MGSKLRIDKLLGELNVGTRSQIKEMAREGRIQVNEQIIKTSDTKVDPEIDVIWLDGRCVNYCKTEYFMLNKPKDVVSATSDHRYQTVIDLIDEAQRTDLFPVGRLDIDTEGLLLITNDGELAHRLLSPKHHVAKVYYLTTDKPIPAGTIEAFKQGIRVDDTLTALPSILEVLSETSANLTIEEGKYHQVKRMMETVGCTVTYLKRIKFGPLALDEQLSTGEYRRLKDEELALLKAHGLSIPE